jgi:hypothetical protein
MESELGTKIIEAFEILHRNARFCHSGILSTGDSKFSPRAQSMVSRTIPNLVPATFTESRRVIAKRGI